MATKQEIIKQAYGEHWNKVCEYVDEKGWCVGYWNICEVLNGISKPRSQGTKWRPKSLEGLEDNNGWIKIESYQDLPKETGHYWVKRGNDIGVNYIIVPESFYSGFLHNLTHYKPVEKTKPPLY